MDILRGIAEDLRATPKRKWFLWAGVLFVLVIFIGLVGTESGVPSNVREKNTELVNPDDLDARQSHPNVKITGKRADDRKKVDQDPDGDMVISIWSAIIVAMVTLLTVLLIADRQTRKPNVILGNTYKRGEYSNETR